MNKKASAKATEGLKHTDNTSCLQNYTLLAAAEPFPLDKKRSGCCIFHCGDHPGCSVAFVANRPYGEDNRRWLWLSAACRYLNRSPLKGIKSPVFRQFNIHCISEGQADSAALPRQTYGIRLKGSSFLRRPSSLNFLRSRYERALFKRYCHFQKAWIQWRHCYLSPSVLFKGVFALEMCANLRHHYLPFSSLPFKKGTLRKNYTS